MNFRPFFFVTLVVFIATALVACADNGQGMWRLAILIGSIALMFGVLAVMDQATAGYSVPSETHQSVNVHNYISAPQPLPAAAPPAPAQPQIVYVVVDRLPDPSQIAGQLGPREGYRLLEGLPAEATALPPRTQQLPPPTAQPLALPAPRAQPGLLRRTVGRALS